MKKLQSFDGLVRERLQQIEARLSVGIRQELMVAELVAEGYEQANIKTLRNAIWRARKKLEAAATATPKMAPAPAISNLENITQKEHAATPRDQTPKEQPLPETEASKRVIKTTAETVKIKRIDVDLEDL